MKRRWLVPVLGVCTAFLLMLLGLRGVRKAEKWLGNDLKQQWEQRELSSEVIGLQAERFLVPCDNRELMRYLSVRRRRFTGIRPGKMDSTLRRKVEDLVAAWPVELRDYMSRHVRQVFIVKNIGASGFAMSHDNRSFTILIDESIIGMRPNEWFRMKEGTIVRMDGTGHWLLHRIEEDSTDLPERLLEGILLHELAHCIGVSEGWTTSFAGHFEMPGHLRFLNGVFALPRARAEMLPELREQFPRLRYYEGRGLLTAEAYVALLSRLGGSEFPTLYATVSDLEFFAEYFYAFVHCNLQGRPLSYTVVSGADTVLHLHSPVNAPQNAGRLAMMEEVLLRLRDGAGNFETIEKDR